MSQEAMNILRNIIDVWLPDFKFGPGKCALDISRTPWYWDTVTSNIKLVDEWGENMVIRHLIMPNHSISWISTILTTFAIQSRQNIVNATMISPALVLQKK
jgi:putative pyruvate formate lyase activating enzyme